MNLDKLHEAVAEWLNDNFADLQPWEIDDDPLEDKYWADLDRRILPIIQEKQVTEPRLGTCLAHELGTRHYKNEYCENWISKPLPTQDGLGGSDET